MKHGSLPKCGAVPPSTRIKMGTEARKSRWKHFVDSSMEMEAIPSSCFISENKYSNLLLFTITFVFIALAN
jgi:hypothetical protein